MLTALRTKERRFELSRGVVLSRGLDCSGSLVDEEETAKGELDAGTGTWRGGRSGDGSGAALLPLAGTDLVLLELAVRCVWLIGV